MTKANDKTVIITLKKESVFESVVKDAFSLSILGALFYFNHHYVGGSYFVNFLILAMIIIYLLNFTHSGRMRRFSKVSDDKMKKVIKILEKKDNE